ncbi:MAG: hypothetical protein DMF68_18310 [Acidobacteria bacterium]|nr:MAG: hypothetical protein DMF68_18310 [Acidobacteriota bacterium]
MKATRATIIVSFCLLLIGLTAHAQTPDTKHFDKDGLSFDYPASWQVSDQSTQQMQFIQLLRGDGYAELRLRAPREWLKTPQKEAEAKRIIQDHYVDNFVEQLQQAGLHPTRSNITTEIAGASSDGVRVRAMLGNDPGGMDSFHRIISNRLVQLSQLGSESDMAKSADAWDMIRNSIKVEPPPQSKPTTTAKPTPTPGKP